MYSLRMCYYDVRDNLLFEKYLQCLKDGLLSTVSEPKQKRKHLWDEIGQELGKVFSNFVASPDLNVPYKVMEKIEGSNPVTKRIGIGIADMVQTHLNPIKRNKKIKTNKVSMVHYLKQIYTIWWSPVGRWMKCTVCICKHIMITFFFASKMQEETFISERILKYTIEFRRSALTHLVS